MNCSTSCIYFPTDRVDIPKEYCDYFPKDVIGKCSKCGSDVIYCQYCVAKCTKCGAKKKRILPLVEME